MRTLSQWKGQGRLLLLGTMGFGTILRVALDQFGLLKSNGMEITSNHGLQDDICQLWGVESIFLFITHIFETSYSSSLRQPPVNLRQESM